MDFTDRTRTRLSRETVAWFTTVNPGGTPITLPVWFLWNGDDEILIYSLTNAARLRNIAANPRVSFHLDGDGHGGEVVVLEGTAAVDAGVNILVLRSLAPLAGVVRRGLFAVAAVAARRRAQDRQCGAGCRLRCFRRGGGYPCGANIGETGTDRKQRSGENRIRFDENCSQTRLE